MSQINNDLVRLPKDTQLLRTSPIEKYAKVKNSMNKPYLGVFNIVEDESNKKVLIVKESTYSSEEEFCVAVLAAQRKKALRDVGLLWLVDYNAEKINNFCSSFHKVKSYYLPHYQDLRMLMRDREAKNTPFSEQELTFMLFHLTSGLATLHMSGFTHKLISPECIDTTNLQNRVAKLMFHQDDPLADVKGIAYNQIQKQKELYLAPEIFTRTSELLKPKTPLYFDERKLDAFSLGMTLLQAGIGKSVQDCYDKRTFKFNEDKLASHLDAFINKHQSNQMLTDAVEKLLSLDTAERIDAVGLQEMFPRIEEIYSYYEIPALCWRRKSTSLQPSRSDTSHRLKGRSLTRTSAPQEASSKADRRRGTLRPSSTEVHSSSFQLSHLKSEVKACTKVRQAVHSSPGTSSRVD